MHDQHTHTCLSDHIGNKQKHRNASKRNTKDVTSSLPLKKYRRSVTKQVFGNLTDLSLIQHPGAARVARSQHGLSIRGKLCSAGVDVPTGAISIHEDHQGHEIDEITTCRKDQDYHSAGPSAQRGWFVYLDTPNQSLEGL